MSRHSAPSAQREGNSREDEALSGNFRPASRSARGTVQPLVEQTRCHGTAAARGNQSKPQINLSSPRTNTEQSKETAESHSRGFWYSSEADVKDVAQKALEEELIEAEGRLIRVRGTVAYLFCHKIFCTKKSPKKSRMGTPIPPIICTYL